MIIALLLILVLTLWGLRYKVNGYFDDYIGISQCNAVKGIFIIVVFLRHILSYIVRSGHEFNQLGDSLVLFFNGSMRQLLVAAFLFYSGYGVMSSFIKKSSEYVNGIPKKRILNTLLNFDIAVLIFILVDICVGQDLSLQQILLSFTAWDSVGNSNWYIFAIIICYASSYIALKVDNSAHKYSKHFSAGGLTSVILLIYIILMYFYQNSWWYDTVLCFPLGMIYAENKEQIEKIIKNNYILSLVFLSIIFGFFYMLPDVLSIPHIMAALSMCLLIVTINMKVKVGNNVLYWLGANLFPLYIYQRIPMIVLYEFDAGSFVSQYVTVYLLLCMLITVTITYFFRYWQIRIR